MTTLPAPQSADRVPPTIPCYRAEDLTQGEDLAEITLGDQVYRLRITRAGKLILTK